MQSYKPNISILYKTLALTLFYICLSFIPASGQSVQKSIDSLKILIEKNPDDWIPYYKLGKYYFLMTQYAEAARFYEKALVLKNDQTTIMSGLIYSYGYLGRYEDMYNLSNRYNVLSDFNNNITLYEEGIAAAFLGKYNEAINLFEKSIKKSIYWDKYNYSRELIIAMIYLNLNDTVHSNIWLEKFLNRPDIRGYYDSRAWAYYLLGYFSKAQIELVKSVDLNEYDSTNFYNWGNYIIVSGDTNGLKKIRKACEIDTSGFAKAMYDAICFVQMDSLEQAKMKLTQKIPDLKNSGIRNGLLAWINEKTGNNEDANKYWFECWGRVPLGINVEAMRKYIERYVRIIKGQQQ